MSTVPHCTCPKYGAISSDCPRHGLLAATEPTPTPPSPEGFAEKVEAYAVAQAEVWELGRTHVGGPTLDEARAAVLAAHQAEVAQAVEGVRAKCEQVARDEAKHWKERAAMERDDEWQVKHQIREAQALCTAEKIAALKPRTP